MISELYKKLREIALDGFGDNQGIFIVYKEKIGRI